MKLRNKQTGEIGTFVVGANTHEVALGVLINGETEFFNTLAELNADWEDAPEEPKEYWYINSDGVIYATDYGKYPDSDLLRKEIGNYFETKEEAEKIVEKLKAWKRLKDKGFKFYRWNKGSLLKSLPNNIEFACDDTRIWSWEDIQDDLDLLFGGEE